MNSEEIDKIIAEQDFIALGAEDILGFGAKYYSNKIKKELFSNEDLLRKFSVKNLASILADLSPKDDKDKIVVEKINKILEDKFDNGEPFITEDYNQNMFLHQVHSRILYMKKISDSLKDKMMEKYLARREEYKGTKLEKIAFSIDNIDELANFVEYADKGIFNDEKIELIENTLSQNKDALKNLNYGLFEDDIFEKLPKKTIIDISKFSSISKKLLCVKKYSPKLFEVISLKVASYDNPTIEYDQISNMIDYFCKISPQIKNIDKINIDTADNLLEYINIVKQNEFSFKEIPEYTENFLENIREEYDKDFDDEFQKYSAFADKLEKGQKRYDELINIIENGEVTDGSLILEKCDIEYLEKNKDSKLTEYKNRLMEIYFNKKYLMSKKDAEKLFQEYAQDLESLKDVAEEKSFFLELEQSLSLEEVSIEELSEIYKNDNNLFSCNQINKFKSNISQACAKTYISTQEETKNKINSIKENKNDGQYQIKYVDGKPVTIVKLTGDMNLFLHSTDTGFIYDKTIEPDYDFKKAWNEDATKEDHILSNIYATQDFMGIPPIGNSGVYYGFYSAPADNIRLMGVSDINTYNRELAFNSATKQYMSANTLPRCSRRVYSEFGMEKQPPDYVALFDDATEEVKNNTLRAASQWGIEVVYIDKQDVADRQIKNLNNMIEEFEKNGSTELLGRIINIYETNVAGWLLNRDDEEDNSHTKNIDNSRFEESFNEVGNRVERLALDYLDNISISEEDKSAELIQVANIILYEQQLYKDSIRAGNRDKISATQMKLNTKEIISKLNNAMDKKNISEYKIDEHTEYRRYLRMVDIAKNAICRDKINISELNEARAVKEQIEKNKSGEVI